MITRLYGTDLKFSYEVDKSLLGLFFIPNMATKER